MSVPEGHAGHCSLCDQRLGLPAWVAVDIQPEPVVVIDPPPAMPLAEGWIWKRFGKSWGAQWQAGKDCCYIHWQLGLIACVGQVPYSVRVVVGDVSGVSPI
jgi:hypothetical protein